MTKKITVTTRDWDIRTCWRCKNTMLLADAQVSEGGLDKFYVCYHCGETVEAVQSSKPKASEKT